MMKVSDPIIFGHAVQVFFKDLFAKHGATLSELGVDFNNGFGDLVAKIDKLPADQKAGDRGRHPGRLCRRARRVAMVNSDKGITNLHVPSDVIVDASMPAMIRAGGKMYDAAGKPQDTLAVIPDSSYAGVYQATIDFCKKHGALRPEDHGHACRTSASWRRPPRNTARTTRPSRSRATAPCASTMPAAQVLLEHAVEAGDIWRACQTKDAPVQDWVKLAVNRARASRRRPPSSGSTKSARTTRRSSPR